MNPFKCKNSQNSLTLITQLGCNLRFLGKLSQKTYHVKFIRGGEKAETFLKVYNSCIWWHRKHSKMFSILSGVIYNFEYCHIYIYIYLNIFRKSSEKPYYTKIPINSSMAFNYTFTVTSQINNHHWLRTSVSQQTFNLSAVYPKPRLNAISALCSSRFGNIFYCRRAKIINSQ